MAIQTRNITVTLNDIEGDPLAGARVEVTLRGLGNGPNGAVAPESLIRITDAAGVATFKLWENRQDYSDTYYEVSSWHPDTGRSIHRRERFYVGGSDADVKDLIAPNVARIDPNQQLLTSVANDRVAAQQAVTEAEGHASTANIKASEAQTSAGNAGNSASSASASATTASQQAAIAAAKRNETEALRNEAAELVSGAGSVGGNHNDYEFTGISS